MTCSVGEICGLRPRAANTQPDFGHLVSCFALPRTFRNPSVEDRQVIHRPAMLPISLESRFPLALFPPYHDPQYLLSIDYCPVKLSYRKDIVLS
ncbi:uncharacterized protein BDZ83DRAFT_453942 [Colletotrichum acutatum]|uniref:Uncharacterized protein n=1 Tax=Glomerella acutata TaxID=27357 RepID=A0AAD8UI83_GLOAC|nr:uncharacterized protein BDZ83DRAFT_453942 [Colletotrichum acutatum]KAK1720293.1 hypothetical protein BDZ83DRAFT_453942 [Colletotrichum acutatum]